MNICFIPTQKKHYENQLFNKSCERHGRLSIYSIAKEILSSDGHEVNTVDKSSGKIDVVIFSRLELAVSRLVECIIGNPEVIIIQYITEPPIAVPFNDKRYFESDIADYFITWDNRFPKHSKIIENHTSWFNSEEAVEQVDFNSKKFLCTISSNKSSKIPGELYSERIRSIKYFGSKSKIDLYGVGWENHKDKLVVQSYRGPVDSKMETLSRYKFAIAFENSIAPGYISEKIFDCFTSNCVPIYLGERNINDYIPPNTFIDWRDFSSYRDLEKHLESISKERYEMYLESIDRFKKDQGSEAFKEEKFSEDLMKCIDKGKDQRKRRKIQSYKKMVLSLFIRTPRLIRRTYLIDMLKALLLR